MKEIFYSGTIENDIMTVSMQHNFPEMLDEQVKSTGIIIRFDDNEPQPLQLERKIPVKKVNINTMEIFYDYIDFIRELTPEERIAELELQQGALLMEIALLKSGGVA